MKKSLVCVASLDPEEGERENVAGSPAVDVDAAVSVVLTGSTAVDVDGVTVVVLTGSSDVDVDGAADERLFNVSANTSLIYPLSVLEMCFGGRRLDGMPGVVCP